MISANLSTEVEYEGLPFGLQYFNILIFVS